MSKGSQIVPIRVPADLMAAMTIAIDRRNAVAAGEPWTRTGFIVTAIREKLAKMERSRGGRRRPGGANQ